MTQMVILNEFKSFQWYDHDVERAFKPNELLNDEMMINGLFGEMEGFYIESHEV